MAYVANVTKTKDRKMPNLGKFKEIYKVNYKVILVYKIN